MKLRIKLGPILLGLELIVFICFYICGHNGLIALARLQKEVGLVENKEQSLKQEIAQLEADIALQKTHPFFQEKRARELQMARHDDVVYYID